MAASAAWAFFEECTPGYYNNEGKPNPRAIEGASYGEGSIKFFQRMAEWRDEGSLEGLEFSN